MKRKWISIRIIVSMCAALGWWGLLYPELTLTPDTVTVSTVDEDGNKTDLTDAADYGSNLYFDLLNAGPGKITLRSRLLTNFSSFWEAFHDKDGNKQKAVK